MQGESKPSNEPDNLKMCAAPHLLLAPLRGFTDAVFRNVFQKHFGGVDEAVAPFVASLKGRRVKPTHLRDLLPEKNRAMPVVPQILSNAGGEFVRLAESLIRLGYEEINWNLGCPYPMVAKKRRGSGLLPYPETIDRLLDEILGSISCRLSIKTRLGRFSPAEMTPLIPVFNRYPLARVIIHPRVGEQMYEGRVDLDEFERCQAQLVHPIVYNGDITDAQRFNELRERFAMVSGWMLGRGVIADPFLPETIKGLPNSGLHKTQRFMAFHQDLVEGYSQIFCGPGHVLDRMKGFWRYFAEGFAKDRKILKRVRKATSLSYYEDIVADFLSRSAMTD